MTNLYNVYNTYPSPYCANIPLYCPMCRYPYTVNPPRYIELRDYGPEPFVVNIHKAAKENNTYRTALWTGCHLQLTLMSINVGDDIGLEVHPTLDQFIRIEEGQGLVRMGNSKYHLDFQRNVADDFAIFIPAGKWHNLINTGDKPIKLYSIYAPPNHPHSIVQDTKPTTHKDNYDN